MKSWMTPLAGVILLMFAAGVVWGMLAPAEPGTALANGLQAPLDDRLAAPLEAAKPVYNWWVCEDLGLGPVPGVSGLRQRFRLCHHQDWEVLAYCTQPGLPAPSLGQRCTRISNKTYQCGSGVQVVREYDILDTPAPSPTITATPGPNDTPTPTPTTPAPSPTFTPTPTRTATTVSPTTPARPACGPAARAFWSAFSRSWPVANPTSRPPHRCHSTHRRRSWRLLPHLISTALILATPAAGCASGLSQRISVSTAAGQS